MDQFRKLFIKKGDEYTELETSNYLLDQEHEAIKKLGEYFFSLSTEELREKQQAMTEAHCFHEMNFQIKDESGQYNKVVATPFHGFAPIRKAYLNEVVGSTKPILKATRRLLQNLFANEDVSESSLGISELPKEVAQELISIIKENIYYEPKVSHNNMKDYPFLSVVGFDCAVANLSNPENIFFEFNAGTPCGIEDQYQLNEHAKEIFPEVDKICSSYIQPDESHKLLKATIDDCANYWTNNPEGISVILSPGPYNPAHPEIASIAKRSGMPLVKIQDLYIDKDGWVRLNVLNQDHPIVTGIYNRKEESFLIYSEKNKIPLRSPFTSQNKKLSEEFGVELKDGILYSYTYDQNFNITGVDIDSETNQAKYQTLFEQISEDPKTNKKGDIIEAIWNKKLFVSNLGGRVFDDKRAFRIISSYLVQESNMARPPQSIDINDLEQNFHKAVIKAPDLSGGAGVIIGAQVAEDERPKEIEKVKSNPQYYEIQELAKLAVINSYSESQDKMIPLPIDWRLIISFGPDEIPNMSTHSCLVRTAPFGSLKTNTSAGGGYALGLILEDQPFKNTNMPETPVNSYITLTRNEDMKSFISEVEKLITSKDKSTIESLTYQLRDLMDLIGLENITWINKLRELMQNQIEFTEFEESYQQFLKESRIKELIID